MNVSQHTGEILDKEHTLVTEIFIKTFDEREQKLYTKIPRNLFNAPVPFKKNTEYNIIISGDQKIVLFNVVFECINIYNEDAVYQFDVLDFNTVDNVRKEERKSVNKQAIYSDFINSSVVRIKDISSSGIRIESKNEIKSKFIELFFDDNNSPRRARAKILWKKYLEDTNSYVYGCKIEYR